MSYRRERAGAAHLHFNALEHGGCLARRIFEGDRPARRLRGPTKLFLLRDRVYFCNYTVDFIRQRVPFRFPLANKTEQIVYPAALFSARIYFEPGRRESF